MERAAGPIIETNADTFKTQVTAQTVSLDTCISELQEAKTRAAAASR